jgi:peroxiredoxin
MSGAATGQAIGLVTPDFTLETTAGATQSLFGALEGTKGAVVVFWSSVCSHCQRYDAYLEDFRNQHPELALLVVASRPQETADEIRAAAGKRGLSFPILVDTGGRVARKWFTEQTPRAFVIDQDRKMIYRGAIDNFQFVDDADYSAYLEPAIEDLLAGRPVAQPETASFGCAIQSVYYNLPKIL